MRCRFHTVGRSLPHLFSDLTQYKTVGQLILKSSLTQVANKQRTAAETLRRRNVTCLSAQVSGLYSSQESSRSACVPVSSLLVSAAEQNEHNRTVCQSVIQRPFSLQLWGGQSGPPPALLSPPSPAWEHHLLLRFKGTDPHLSDKQQKAELQLGGAPKPLVHNWNKAMKQDPQLHVWEIQSSGKVG